MKIWRSERAQRHKIGLCIGISLSIVSLFYSLAISFDVALCARTNTGILQKESENFVAIKSINDDGISTSENILYPMDFVDESIYPILNKESESYYNTLDKCIFKPIAITEVISNVVMISIFTALFDLFVCLLLDKGKWIALTSTSLVTICICIYLIIMQVM